MARRAALALLAAVALTAGCGAAASERQRGPTPQAKPGDVALDYITRDNYRTLLVEVDYAAGVRPSSAALDKLREKLLARLDKDDVFVEVDSEIPPSHAKPRYQVADILGLEAIYRRNFTGDARNPGQAVIWIVYLDGESEFDSGGTRALGISYDASSIAVFRRNIQRTTPAGVEAVVEGMVLIHEGGHLFGLVNNGLPMVNDHEDPANFRHDRDADCIMRHKIETSDVARLLERPPDDFDYQCRLDMFAAGGRDPGAPDSDSPAASSPETRPTPRPRGPSGPLLHRGEPGGSGPALRCGFGR